MLSPFRDDFPTELITKILCNLPYRSLLAVLGVSKRFNAIVTEDLDLSVQLFKKMSKVYVEPSDDKPKYRRDAPTKGSDPVRLHPAFPSVSYLLGNSVEDASFFIGDQEARLVDLPIANDFVSIPVVTMMHIHVHDSFDVVVENPEGVRLVDFFRALATESCVAVEDDSGFLAEEFGEEPTRATLLGDHRFYEGISYLTKKGDVLMGMILCGS